MRWAPYLICCWPGLARLWTKGHSSSLVVAIGFAVLLNLALVSTFLWPTSLGITFPLVAWPTLLLIWTTSAVVTYRSIPDELAEVRHGRKNVEEVTDTLFNQAQREYLRGHWTDAEKLLKRRLHSKPRDIESRLLLATLLRHSRRLKEASEELDGLLKLDESIQWKFEISRERQLIEWIKVELNTSFDDAPDDSATIDTVVA